MENPIKLDDLGVPPFSETSISSLWGLHFCRMPPIEDLVEWCDQMVVFQSLNPLRTGSPSRKIARCFIFPNSLQVVFFVFEISGWWIWILTYILSHWFEYIWSHWFEAICLIFSQIFGTVLWDSLDVQANTFREAFKGYKHRSSRPVWLEDGDWMSRLHTYISLNHYRSRICLLKTCYLSSSIKQANLIPDDLMYIL